jgi:hypothetical protein
MNERMKQEIAEHNRVIVEHGLWDKGSTCQHKQGKKRCGNRQKYMVAIGMNFKLSTVIAYCCDKHLPHFVDKAIMQSRETIKRDIKYARQEEIRNAKAILKES